nr:MAG TPA: hypothetical protein [Caudoviricetes sp.]
MGRKLANNNEIRPTNGWDVLSKIIDGFFGLFNLPQIASVAIAWIIVRDIIFVFRLPKEYDYAGQLLPLDFISKLLSNDNTLVIVCIILIIVLICACICLIGYCKVLKNEINRISNVRSQAIHGKENIEVHTSSL